jgi:hypothetical protein
LLIFQQCAASPVSKAIQELSFVISAPLLKEDKNEVHPFSWEARTLHEHKT